MVVQLRRLRRPVFSRGRSARGSRLLGRKMLTRKQRSPLLSLGLNSASKKSYAIS